MKKRVEQFFLRSEPSFASDKRMAETVPEETLFASTGVIGTVEPRALHFEQIRTKGDQGYGGKENRMTANDKAGARYKAGKTNKQIV